MQRLREFISERLRFYLVEILNEVSDFFQTFHESRQEVGNGIGNQFCRIVFELQWDGIGRIDPPIILRILHFASPLTFMLDFTPIMYVKLADSTLGIEKAIVASHFPHFLIFFILSMKKYFWKFSRIFSMKLPVSRRLYLRVDRVPDFGIYHNRSNIEKIPTISWKIGSPSPSNWSDIPVIR